MTKTITITSGKGGVGKTNTSLNLAITLAQLQQKVCLFDADFGMANINILLGLHPSHTIHDVIIGHKTIQDIMMHDIYGIDILPGSSGIESMADISQSQVNSLLDGFKTLPTSDFLLFDTAAGMSKQVLSF
jgi:flagellar biosynthesis protein FlhG